MGFNALRQVDRIAPKVITQPRTANHSRDHRTRVDADTNRKIKAAVDGNLFADLDQFQRKIRHAFYLMVNRYRCTGNGHIGITDGFDFLHAMFLRELVKPSKNIFKQTDQLRGQQAAGQLGKTHHIGKPDFDTAKSHACRRAAWHKAFGAGAESGVYLGGDCAQSKVMIGLGDLIFNDFNLLAACGVGSVTCQTRPFGLDNCAN